MAGLEGSACTRALSARAWTKGRSKQGAREEDAELAGDDLSWGAACNDGNGVDAGGNDMDVYIE